MLFHLFFIRIPIICNGSRVYATKKQKVTDVWHHLYTFEQSIIVS